MRNIAHLLLARGAAVVAADVNIKALNGAPALRGATLVDEKAAAEMLQDADAVIYSDALETDHPLRIQGRRLGKPLISYHEAIAQLAENFRLVAVAGTHGKSSTTALLAHILVVAGHDPTALVGADLLTWGCGSRAGKSDLFILEADEFRDHFLSFRPAHAIITSIDFDHPDYFTSLEHVVRSFNLFLHHVEPTGAVIIPSGMQHRFPQLTWPAGTQEVEPAGPVPANLLGTHMASNAALAVEMAVLLGVSRGQAAAALALFGGLARRTETLGIWHGLMIISDYGHHPSEIAATLAAVQEKYRGRRIAVLFEPHMLTRLTVLRDDFVTALSRAETVVLAPVFVPHGREDEAGQARAVLRQVNEKLLERGVAAHTVEAWPKLEARVRALHNNFDIVLAFSAGELDQKLRSLVKKI
jgi:UDP-N-acetylmuramate--alanine ligase